MNAPVRAPRVATDRFATLLAATPAPVATGGVVRVAHCLERSAVETIPTALREHLRWLEAEEGRVTWRKVDGGAWLRSVLCVERGPIDLALTRAFELATTEGWLPAGAWRRGYDGEHNDLEAQGWHVIAWKTRGGYASQGDDENVNAARERLWLSPHCLHAETQRQRSLFDALGGSR